MDASDGKEWLWARKFSVDLDQIASQQSSTQKWIIDDADQAATYGRAAGRGGRYAVSTLDQGKYSVFWKHSGPPVDVVSTKSPVLINVQSARLFAAMLVVIHHTNHEAIDNGIASPDVLRFAGFIDGSLGVDIFFVISGLIMILTSANRFGSKANAWEFLKRRLSRIAPLYWLFTVLMVIALVALPSGLNHHVPSVWQVAASLLFIPTTDTVGVIQPVLGVGWTLNYEMLFYVVFTVAMLWRRSIGIPIVFVTLLALILLGHVLPAGTSVLLSFWSNPITVEFLFGILLGIGLERGYRVGLTVTVMLAVAGLALLWLATTAEWIDPPMRWLAVGLPATMIVCAAAFGPQPAQSPPIRLLRLGGDASYALYLSHPFTINVVAIIWKRSAPGGALAFVVIATLVSLGVGVLVHLLAERPLLDLLHRRPVALMDHPLVLKLRRSSR